MPARSRSSLATLLFLGGAVTVVGCESLLGIDDPTLAHDAAPDAALDAIATDATTEADSAAWSCVGTTCDDGNPCTSDGCSAGACAFKPLTGSSCADADWCNGQESCVDGKCQPGAPPGNVLVCRTEPCPDGYYTFEYTHRDVCGDPSLCTNARDCRPVCEAVITVCCSYDDCVCPPGYVSQGTTKKICFCATTEGDAIKCARI